MGKYNVNEGNQKGYMPTEFDQSGNLVETKIVADGDLKAGQVVELSGNMKVKATTGASTKVLGVSMFDAKDGEAIAVEAEGLFKLVAGAAITAGQRVASAANGQVGPAADGAANIGIALSDAAKDEEVFVKFSI